MEVAKLNKKKKSEMGETAIQTASSLGITAKQMQPPPQISANQKPLGGEIVKGILSGVKKKEPPKRPKDADAVTNIDGEIIYWKASSNPAYDEKIMRLQRQSKKKKK